MTRASRVLWTALVLVFVSALLARPLLSNPAVASILEGGEFGWAHLLGLPLLVIAALLVAVRLRSLRETDVSLDQRAAPMDRQRAGTRVEAARSTDESRENISAESGRVREQEGPSAEFVTGPVQEGYSDESGSARKQMDSGDGPEETAADRDREESAQFSILTGQGGTRNKDFEIEEEPPEVELGAHLEHLRDTLGDDEDLREDLESFEAVVEQESSDNPVPARCPEPHCNALWSERGILGWGSGKYEILEDERTIVCLSCESTHTVRETE